MIEENTKLILESFDEKFVLINKEGKEIVDQYASEIKDFLKASLKMQRNEIIQIIESESFDNVDEWWVKKEIMTKLKDKEDFI